MKEDGENIEKQKDTEENAEIHWGVVSESREQKDAGEKVIQYRKDNGERGEVQERVNGRLARRKV